MKDYELSPEAKDDLQENPQFGNEAQSKRETASEARR